MNSFRLGTLTSSEDRSIGRWFRREERLLRFESTLMILGLARRRGKTLPSRVVGAEDVHRRAVAWGGRLGGWGTGVHGGCWIRGYFRGRRRARGIVHVVDFGL